MRVSISRRVRTAKTPLPVHVGVVRDLCAGGHYRDARSRPWTRPVSRFRPLYSSVASRSRPRRPLPRHSAVALGWRGLRSRSPPSDPVVQPLRCPRAGSGPRSALPAVVRVLGPGPPGSAVDDRCETEHARAPSRRTRSGLIERVVVWGSQCWPFGPDLALVVHPSGAGCVECEACNGELSQQPMWPGAWRPTRPRSQLRRPPTSSGHQGRSSRPLTAVFVDCAGRQDAGMVFAAAVAPASFPRPG
jgi:hypothetical protein